ncbi:hypothetical protein IQ07DRAFT_647454 [Pyrenochaeta sp. DS3sAY3a]|nr:hypothetical protein IQ07DRAFT_647454 [Pyrenochaeta sp. DS3sAY3a]
MEHEEEPGHFGKDCLQKLTEEARRAHCAQHQLDSPWQQQEQQQRLPMLESPAPHSSNRSNSHNIHSSLRSPSLLRGGESTAIGQRLPERVAEKAERRGRREQQSSRTSSSRTLEHHTQQQQQLLEVSAQQQHTPQVPVTEMADLAIREAEVSNRVYATSAASDLTRKRKLAEDQRSTKRIESGVENVENYGTL